MGRDRGQALILVLLVMVTLIIVAAGIARLAHSESQIARNYGDVIRCRWAARTGVDAAIQRLKTTIAAQPSTYLGEDPYTVSSSADDLNLDLGGYTFDAVIEDEAGKVNVNTASESILGGLCGSVEMADCILDWRNPASTPSAQGAETAYYMTLDPPYTCRNAPFETNSELTLVKGVTDEALSSPSAVGARLLGDLMTVYTPRTASAPAAGAAVDIQTANNQALQTAFGSILSAQDIGAIISYRSRRAFRSPAEIVRVGLSRAKIQQIFDRLTVSGYTARTGLVNVNTAPMEVLAVQPGLDATTAQAIIDYRTAQGAFDGVGGILAVSQLSDDAFVSSAPYFTVRSSVFRIRSTGSLASAGPSATITCIVEVNSSQTQIRYWQE